MGKFREQIEKGFVTTIEIAPPKGAEVAIPLEIAKKISGRVAGVNVTDNQRAMMHMSALVFSHLMTEVGAEPICQMACRDRNRLALQSDLLGAMALGVENLCIMTGDYPTLGDNPQSKPVFDLDAPQLINAAHMFSQGTAFNGKPLKGCKDFYIGAVFNPFYNPIELEIFKAEKKIAAGARFFQTQPFFDMASLDAFLELVKDVDAKFLVGVTPLKSVKMIDFLNNSVLTTPIPEEVSARIANAEKPELEGMKMSAEFVNAVRDKVDGVHIMPVGQLESIPLLLDMIEEGKKR
ncbi:MAG: methylenetetrahydrofolate reductase [Nitrospinae bacterium]|nr:methylenetetrahydrofolate reductase [Nitrospinota bacterium]